MSPSATWELQQLVLLLQIDPQNVGVDTINVGHDPEKMERLSNTVCQTLGIKIAHKADLSNHHHKISPKHSPSPATKSSPNTIKMSPKSVKSPPLTNGVKESPKNSPPTTNHVKLSPTPTPTLKIITSPPLKNSLKTKVQDTKSSKAKPEKSLNPLKITMSASGGSIIRYVFRLIHTHLKHVLIAVPVLIRVTTTNPTRSKMHHIKMPIPPSPQYQP